MTPENHRWTPGGEPPRIRPHSLARHRVIDAYLRRYVEVLTQDPRIPEFRLTLVDGFSGGGVYRDWQTGERRNGSPLIMLNAMRDAAADAQKDRQKSFNLDVEYFFIEKAFDAFSVLQTTLDESEFHALLGQKAHLLQGVFVDHLPAILERIKERGRGKRAIFVLDQFGYTDVPMPQIRRIFQEIDNPEVILTFATDAMINYLSENEKTQKILERVGLTISPSDIANRKLMRDWRRAIQLLLHEEIHQKSGARFYTPFFIRSPDEHRDFWLIHLSGNAKARDVMVTQHWAEKTSFAHYGGSGLKMLGYDPNEDFSVTRQAMLPGFYFDDTALASSHESLMEQLPERIFSHGSGIPFGEFFAGITNETPVTSEIIKDVLEELTLKGWLKVESRNGTRRKKRVQHRTDVIMPVKQRQLYLPGADI